MDNRTRNLAVLGVIFPDADVSITKTDGWAEQNVNCFFHPDDKASASIKPEEGFFYCHGCPEDSDYKQHNSVEELIQAKTKHQTGNEISWIEAKQICDTMLGASSEAATNLQSTIPTPIYTADSYQKIINKYGFTVEALQEVEAAPYGVDGFKIPIKIEETEYGEIIRNDTHDVKLGKPKSQLSSGARTGYLVPYRAWEKLSDAPTIVCEGEKDMLIARSKGFNAVCISGGANANFKALWLVPNKVWVIIYDNDLSGKKGATKLAKQLLTHGAKKVLNVSLADTLKNKGEDLYDYFTKYNKTSEDLNKKLQSTKEVSLKTLQTLTIKSYPTKKLKAARSISNIGKWFKTTVRTHVSFGSRVNIPLVAEVTYYDKKIKADNIKIFNIKDDYRYMLNLITDDTKTKQFIAQKLFTTTSSIRQIDIKDSINLSKYTFEDVEEGYKHLKDYTKSESYDAPSTIDGWVKNKELVAGKNYNIIYQVVPHPRHQQLMTVMAKEATLADDYLTNFKVNDKVKQALDKFKVTSDQTLEDKINILYKQARGYVGNYLNKNIFLATELTFTSPLFINDHTGKELKSAIWAAIIGNTRTGKSETFKYMSQQYRAGAFINVKTATEASFIGGSVPSTEGWKITIGTLAKNDKKMVALEEAHAMPPSTRSTLTDARSRGKIKIGRVGSELNANCAPRVLEIANPISEKSIDRYPNGLKVISEIIPRSEDVARYDFFLLIGEISTVKISDKKEVITPFEPVDYNNRINYIWSRNKDQIIISPETWAVVEKETDALHTKFKCDYHILGRNAASKVIKIAASVACMVANTDETYTKVIVNATHVRYAAKWLDEIYSSKWMRLDVISKHYKKLSEYTPEDIVLVKKMIVAQKALMKVLYETTDPVTLNNLKLTVDFKHNEFTKFIKDLEINYLLINHEGTTVKASGKLMDIIKNHIDWDNVEIPDEKDVNNLLKENPSV